MMRNKQSQGKDSLEKLRPLILVDSSQRHAWCDQTAPLSNMTADLKMVKQLTNLMMNSLRVLHSTTTVVMLDVGLSRTNFDELSKWIGVQIKTSSVGNAFQKQPYLERRFRRTVDHIPEL